MWMHHDLAWWGVFLAVVALIAMLPVSILANILTPKLKNWWAERSEASTRKRIETLEKILADYEQNYKELSASEDYILKGIEALGMVGTVCIEILAVVLLVVVWTLPLIINTPGNIRFVLGGPL